MVTVGIIGLGMMGRVHYEAYQGIPTARVIAVADADPVRARGDLAGTAGNILAGGVTHLPMDRIQGFTDWRSLLARTDVQVVDICLPTPAHREVAVAALAAGKHVICEKPLARTSADAHAIAEASRSATGYFMPAMCMRFWPGWTWLKSAVETKRFGAVVAATFRRVASMPAGWYSNGSASGGALLDLHIHDVDAINWLFGRPSAVFSRGYQKTTGSIDHIVTQYLYPSGPLISAEGGWAMADGFGFSMRFTVNFEQATADFDLGRAQPLMLHQGGRSEAVPIGDGAGYAGELQYFLDCVERRVPPATVTASDGVTSVEICEAELRSVTSGAIATLS